MALKPLHVVQISYDDTVFLESAPSDTWQRQCRYTQILTEKRPGSRMVFLSLTARSGLQSKTNGSLTCIPISGTRLMRIWRLIGSLFQLHRACRIDLLATQTIFIDAWI